MDALRGVGGVMATLDSCVKDLDGKIERIIRGGGHQAGNMSDINAAADALFDVLLEDTTRQELKKLSDADATARTSVAVKLHNKVRSVADAFVEMRARTKCCAAMYLNVLCRPGAKAICICLKLLANAGSAVQPYSRKMAEECCRGCIVLFSAVNMDDLSRQMPPMELVDVKVAVFTAYLDYAGMLVQSKDMDRLQQAVAGAMDLVQALPDGKKTRFVRELLNLGSSLTEGGTIAAATQLVQTASNCVDQLLANSGAAPAGGGRTAVDHAGTATREELTELKVRALLSLAHCYKATDQCDKAMVSLQALDALLATNPRANAAAKPAFLLDIAHASVVAKFGVHLHGGNWAAAQECMNGVLNVGGHRQSLQVIDEYLHAISNRSSQVALNDARSQVTRALLTLPRADRHLNFLVVALPLAGYPGRAAVPRLDGAFPRGRRGHVVAPVPRGVHPLDSAAAGQRRDGGGHCLGVGRAGRQRRHHVGQLPPAGAGTVRDHREGARVGQAAAASGRGGGPDERQLRAHEAGAGGPHPLEPRKRAGPPGGGVGRPAAQPAASGLPGRAAAPRGRRRQQQQRRRQRRRRWWRGQRG